MTKIHIGNHLMDISMLVCSFNARLVSPLRSDRGVPVKPGADQATRSNWTVQLRLLVCGGLQLVRDDRELFLMRFKFRIAVQSRLLVCTVLQLVRNNLFIGNTFSQSNYPVVSRDAV